MSCISTQTIFFTYFQLEAHDDRYHLDPKPHPFCFFNHSTCTDENGSAAFLVGSCRRLKLAGQGDQLILSPSFLPFLESTTPSVPKPVLLRLEPLTNRQVAEDPVI
jgi:hypothetical protein